MHDVGISLCRTNRTAAQQTDRQTERLTAQVRSTERPSDQLGDHPAPRQSAEPKPDQGDCPLRMAFFELSSPRLDKWDADPEEDLSGD